MNDGSVAAVEPPVANDSGRGLRVAVIALHHDVSACDDLAERFAVARHVISVGRDDAKFARGDELDALARLDSRTIRSRQLGMLWPFFTDGDEGRGFRQPIDLRHRPAEPFLDGSNGGRRRW